MTITAATPMTIPSIVSIARILFLRMLCSARPIRIASFMPRAWSRSSRSLAALCRLVTGSSRRIRPSRISTMRVA